MVDEETGRVEMVLCDHIAVHSLLVNQTKLTTNVCCQDRCGGVPNSAEIFWEKIDSVRRYKKTGKVNFFLSKLKLLRIQHDSRITNKCEKIFVHHQCSTRSLSLCWVSPTIHAFSWEVCLASNLQL